MKRYIKVMILCLISAAALIFCGTTILADSVGNGTTIYDLTASVVRADFAISAAVAALLVGVLIFIKRNYMGKSMREEKN